MWHIVEKISTRATTFLQTSLQSEVYTQSYGPPKVMGFRVLESHLGVSRQNAIWMWPPWRGIEYIIRGKVVASPKSRMWWVLWVRVCLWFLLAYRVLKLCTNQFVVWYVQIDVNDWMLVHFFSPILKLHHTLLPLKCYEARSVPWFFALPLFSLQTDLWVYQGASECVTWYQRSGRSWSTYWRFFMALKKSLTLVKETMVEEPTQDLEVPTELNPLNALLIP